MTEHVPATRFIRRISGTAASAAARPLAAPRDDCLYLARFLSLCSLVAHGVISSRQACL